MTADDANIAADLLRRINSERRGRLSTRTAEMTKLLENIFRSVNIALVNELALLSERMGIDIWEVIDAAATKPFGFLPFYPGPGVGGHCIPVDPYYLSWKAREFDFSTRFIELAAETNQRMPYHVVELVGSTRSESGARACVRPASSSSVPRSSRTSRMPGTHPPSASSSCSWTAEARSPTTIRSSRASRSGPTRSMPATTESSSRSR